MGKFEGGAGVLLDEEHTDPPGGERGDHFEYFRHDQGCQSERRLVEQQEPRVTHQRPGDRKHLLLTAREGAAELVHPLAKHGKQAADLVDVTGEFGPVSLREAAKLQVLADGESRKDAAAFWSVADPEPHHLVGLHGRQRRTGETDRPATARYDTRDRHQQGRLAGAIGTDQRHQFAVFDVE